MIQFPMNLVEANAVRVKNNGPNNSQTLLQVALDADMGVLVNRPLNAIKDGELLRLSDFDCRTPDQSSKKLHKVVAELEAEFLEGLAGAFESGGVPTTELFCFSEPLKTVAGQISDAIQWDGYISQVFSPEISRRVEHVNEILSGPLQAAWHLWLERYVDAMSDLSDAYRVACARLSQKRSNKIHSAVEPFIPSDMQTATLSQKALYCVLGQLGVTVALVGMRQPHYVDDALSLLDRAQMQTSDSALSALGKIK
ncbi:MAG TPA: hypothetical protein EYN06_08335 [Myxococcales bacterium]|nr:hypothetical protein [Myxococcales bacterium]HIN86475.1 hypothetical protein [Myxococcales bacterium]